MTATEIELMNGPQDGRIVSGVRFDHSPTPRVGFLDSVRPDALDFYVIGEDGRRAWFAETRTTRKARG